MLKKRMAIHLVIGFMAISVFACIGDDFVQDFVPPRIEIMNPIDSLKVGETYQYKYFYFNNVGLIDSSIDVSWQSLAPDVVSVSSSGLATALSAGTTKIVIASVTNPPVYDTTEVISNTTDTSNPNTPTMRTGTIQSTSTYLLEGDFELRSENGQLILKLLSNFKATTALPGLYLYMTNNPNTNNGALELGPITQFSGEQEHILPNTTDINTYDYVLFYCKPFVVKVGDGMFVN